MRKYLIGLIALFALVVVTLVNASFFTGNDMMQQCKDTETGESLPIAPKYNACVSYLAGLVDAQETLGHWKIVLNPLICVPEDVNEEQLRQVFLGHMNRHPEKWHLKGAHRVTRHGLQNAANAGNLVRYLIAAGRAKPRDVG